MKIATRIPYLAAGSPEHYVLAESPAIAPPAVCQDCEHLVERGTGLGYPPLCQLIVNTHGQPCAAAFDTLLRIGRWPDDRRCPGRGR